MPGRKIFHRTPQHLPQRRFFFQPSPSPTPQARKNSPCSPPSASTRERVRPAPPKLPKISAFSPAGRTFRSLFQNPLLLGEFFALMGATAVSQHPPTTSPETDDTSASSFPHTVETTDTFARTKRPFSGHFPPAKASRVSCNPRRAHAKAMTVSPSPRATPTAQTVRDARTRHNAGGTLAT